MDIEPISELESVRSSSVPQIFIDSFNDGSPGTWHNFFSGMKKEWHPDRENASKQAWRKKVKSCVKKGELTLEENPLFKEDFKKEQLELFKKRNKGLETPVSGCWFQFEQLVIVLKNDNPDPKVSTFLDFLLSLESRKFDFEEMLMWMLCAYLELLRLVDFKCDINDKGNNSQIIFTPIDQWIPESEEGLLCTTRYMIMTYLTEIDNCRNYRHLRGTPRLFSADSVETKYRRFSVRLTMLRAKESNTFSPSSNNPIGIKKYEMLLRFVDIFEFIQLDMLSKKIPAHRICSSFSRLPSVQKTLRKELYEYSIQSSI